MPHSGESLFNLLQGEEHHAVPPGESANVGDESLVEGAEALILDRLVNDVEWSTILSRSGIHYPRLENINWGSHTACSEPGHASAGQMARDAVFEHTGAQHHLLVLVI